MRNLFCVLCCGFVVAACAPPPPIDLGEGEGEEGEGEGEGEGEEGEGEGEGGGEVNCADFVDDDDDGRIDCDDDDCVVGCAAGAAAPGAACAQASDCAVAAGGAPACLDEAGLGYPGGQCASWCDVAANDCGADAYCLEFGFAGRGVCTETCDPDVDDPVAAGCRAGYGCAPFAISADVTLGLCVPGCTADDQCPVRGACFDNPGQFRSGFCVDPELCDESDGDGDGRLACEDEDCAAVAACDTAALCAAPTPLPLDTDVTGDTTGGTQLLSSSCTGNFLGHERVFTVTPGAAGQTGVLQVAFTGAPDLGLALRARCDDRSSEVACADNAVDGEGETLFAAVEGGVPYVLLVDAIGDVDQGPFTLRATFVADVCGDGQVTGLENCDEGQLPAVDGDGCSSRCTTELDVLCAEAGVIDGDAVEGDTRLGRSAIVQASCSLPQNTAREQIWQFVASATGTAELQLANVEAEKDLAVYVHTACGDVDSEVACSDGARGGGTEIVQFPVVAGARYFVFVDGTISSPFDDGTYALRLRILP